MLANYASALKGNPLIVIYSRKTANNGMWQDVAQVIGGRPLYLNDY